MAACAQCGHPEVTGRFCGACGAPVSAQTPAVAPPQPPAGPPAYPTPRHLHQAPAPKRANGLLIALGVIGGVVLFGLIGLFVLAALLPDEEVVPAAGPGAEQSPAAPLPDSQPATPNPLGMQWVQKQVPGIKLVSQGRITEPFLQSHWFYEGLILARNDRAGNTEVLTFYYENGKLLPSKAFMAPLGEVRQLTAGDLLNTGTVQALALSQRGMMLVNEEEDWETIDAEGISEILVADWDGDGLHEMAVFFTGQTQARARRYTAAGGWVTLGDFPGASKPPTTVISRLTLDKRRLLIGGSPGGTGAELKLGLYTLDFTRGFEPAYLFALPQLQPATSFQAAALNGKAVIVVAHQGKPSYLSLYEIVGDKAEPMGVITLPNEGQYQVHVGPVSDSGRNEILAIDQKTGTWVLYGF